MSLSLESKILSSLNDSQKKAVLETEGPVLVIAGAGTGKTKVLTHRIAYLVGVKKISPFHILACTFTNKAASEMKERIRKLLKESVEEMWIGTFHHICVRILRIHAPLIGFTRNFSIYDRDDQKSVLKKILDEKKGINESPGKVASRLSRFKMGEYQPEDERELEVFLRYEEILKSSNAFDFDDLLIKTIEIFEKFPAVRDGFAKRFRYIHVDEYQDTNKAQYILLKHLSKVHKNIFVVGDEDQSIYGFRGARIWNIFDFEKDFKGTKLIKLEENYRSTKTIIRAASYLVSHNRLRKGKNLWTRNKEGRRIPVIVTEDELDEALKIGDIIRRTGRPFSHYLILYRTNAQSRAFEEIFRRKGIPHSVIGTVRFYERREIKDLLAYLRVIVNPSDNLSLKRVMNTPPRGIGKRTVEILEKVSKERNVSIWDTLSEIGAIENLREDTRRKLREFKNFLVELKEEAEREDAYKILKKIIDSIHYFDYLREGSEPWEATQRIENVRELLGSVKDFVKSSASGSVEEYISSISIKSEIDDWEGPREDVTLMTVHNAKGLEFPVVFVTGLEEGVFPHQSSYLKEEEMEEERRLFHVALTRAKEEVYLSYSLERHIRPNRILSPSRFLDELPEDAILWKRKEEWGEDSFKRGDKVYHDVFGEGKVLEAYNGKVKVLFKDGVRVLLLEYAKLKKID